MAAVACFPPDVSYKNANNKSPLFHCSTTFIGDDEKCLPDRNIEMHGVKIFN
jgi:hypothetical protein